jgi:hypothetical protein
VKYYVYVYLDPRKKGIFKYLDIEFEYEPFYVGKGHGDRYLHHVRKIKNNNKVKISQKYARIIDIISDNMDPVILKIGENMEEDDSLILEKKIIQSIGRLDLSSGPLTNRNDGGLNPQLNYRHSEETKRKISESGQGKSTDFISVISPSGEVFEKVSLLRLCKDKNLNYDLMRKSRNKGRIEVKNKSISNINTLNSIGWSVINSNKSDKEKERKIRFILISPCGKEYKIHTDENGEELILKMGLSLRTLRIYRNRGVINIRNINQCESDFSRNCQGWQFLDMNHGLDIKSFESKSIPKWKLKSPNGDLYIVGNLRNFCQENNLSYRTLQSFLGSVVDMRIRKNYSNEVINTIGWYIESIKGSHFP